LYKNMNKGPAVPATYLLKISSMNSSYKLEEASKYYFDSLASILFSLAGQKLEYVAKRQRKAKSGGLQLAELTKVISHTGCTTLVLIIDSIKTGTTCLGLWMPKPLKRGTWCMLSRTIISPILRTWRNLSLSFRV
jgi:hypothetical protein